MRICISTFVVATLLAFGLPAASTSAQETCSFSRGVTTCVNSTQSTETGKHEEISGCTYGPTLPPVAGRRTTVFEDTYNITTTTTTYSHGRKGRIFDTKTQTSRTLVSSREISSVCERV